MFEVPKDTEETKKMRLLIGSAVVVVVLVLTAIYLVPRRGAEGPPVSAATAVKCTPDPVKDLKVDTAKMDKDYTGTWAVWAVNIHNNSAGCAYASIEYETTYVRADDTVLVVNKGTLTGRIGPGEERDFPEMRDVLFPTGTALYRFKITGAKVATP